MTATPVAPITLSSSVRAFCAVCDGLPAWQVGPTDRACDRCLAVVLRAVRSTSDGFTPPLVLPIGARR